MFEDNKYYRWYIKIVSKEDNCLHTERHHIIPKSLGGSNDPENIVRLSIRKHFLAHWLLTKFTSGIDQKKMLKALGCMIGNRSKKITSWQYEKAKIASKLARIGDPSPMKGKKHSKASLDKMRVARLGKKHSEEHKAKISKAGMGRVFLESSRFKISIAHLGMTHSDAAKEKIRKSKTGVKYSEETKKKISIASMGNKSKTGLKDSDETRERKRLSHKTKSEAQVNSSTGLRGVTKHANGKFRTRTRFCGKTIEIGVFDCPAAAYFAYVVKNDELLSTLKG